MRLSDAQAGSGAMDGGGARAYAIGADGRDSHIVSVADHGIDPRPRPAHRKAPDGDDETSGWRDTLIWFGIPVIVMLLIRVVFFGFYSIPSGSMMDTIEIGDRVITTQLTTRFTTLQRGDIIVFRDPAHWLNNEEQPSGQGDLIKRLIGMPGDVVACEGGGKPVTINGVPINETSYIRPGVEPSNFAFRVTVTAGHVFVMGDNRSNSADSRYHQDDGEQGLVPISDVRGVGLVTYWPLSRIGRLNAHHEVFRHVPDHSAEVK